MVIRALCDAPSKVAQKVQPVLVDGCHCFGRDWYKQVYEFVSVEQNTYSFSCRLPPRLPRLESGTSRARKTGPRVAHCDVPRDALSFFLLPLLIIIKNT